LFFYLRFRSQLRRTRPELLKGLEKFIVLAIEAAGGNPKNERRLLSASFDETALGVWLDILILIESIVEFLNEAAADLYGYSLVIGRDIPEEEEEGLCLRLAGTNGLSGKSRFSVWCDPAVQQALGYYFYFEKPRIQQESESLSVGYACLKGIKAFTKLTSQPGTYKEAKAEASIGLLREAVLKALKQGGRKNILLMGPEYSGKRDGLYRHCEKILGDIPPLIIRFGAGGRFLSPLADAYCPEIRKFIAASDIPAEILQDLDNLGEALFRDRLRSEISIFMARTGCRFFTLLLEAYYAAVKKKDLSPVLILENIHRAEDEVVRIFMDTWSNFAVRGELLVYGTAFEGRAKVWEKIFSRVVRLDSGIKPSPLPNMSRDLWEIAYAFYLLGRYFPGHLLGKLLEEEGKNPLMISRALDMFVSLGVVDTGGDPRPRIKNFLTRSERILGERKEKVRALVRNCLLTWVSRGRIFPCFAFLEALAELEDNGEVSAKTIDGVKAIARKDELVLKGITSDLVNGTYRGIEQAIKARYLQKIIGKERVFTILYLFRTNKALIHGDEGEIREVFGILPAAEEGEARDSPEQPYPAYKAPVLVNITAYHLGVRDIAAALETVKEAMLLSQKQSGSGLTQSYRFFSLVNLSRQKMGEAIDYMTFAVENAEKFGNFDEMGISSYYAASVQFLFGNLSKAERLAAQAETYCAQAGRSEWTDRVRFLRGKLAFDLGRYQDARFIFEDILNNPAGLGSSVKEGLLTAWVYRSRVYSQNPLIPKPEGGGADADLFEIEASYLAEDFERTVELSRRLAATVPQDYFLFTEQPDWRSGFSQCELLLLPQKEFWDRMIAVYHSLALCHISAAGGEAAVQNMHRILRDERLSEMDPNDAFYFYAWYRVLEEAGAAQVDMNTAVSMAFKRLQRRAGNIDEVETRRAYFFQPRWNNVLSLAAKEYKLI
jgi:tetratricopeptide (TPR) repeat protein